MIRLAVLGSTRGTNLTVLHEAIETQHLNAQIKLVVSNKKEAFILERARSFNLPTHYLAVEAHSRETYDEKLSMLLKEEEIELIVLIGYMRILSSIFTQTWENKIINVHPSLLPLHAGKMDLAVHQAVLAAGESESGCSVHYVTEHVDAGPVLIQKRCAVLAEDTPESLKARVQALEGIALVEAIQKINSI